MNVVVKGCQCVDRDNEICTRSRGSDLGIVPQPQVTFEFVDVEAEFPKEICMFCRAAAQLVGELQYTVTFEYALTTPTSFLSFQRS